MDPLGDAVTPVLKRTAKRCISDVHPDVFDDSFVHISSIKEEPKSLYGATQLASLLAVSSSSSSPDEVKKEAIKEEPAGDNFPESHGHFDSFLRDLSEHESFGSTSKLSLKKTPSKLSTKKLPETKPLAEHAMPDFQIVSDDFFDQLEKMFVKPKEDNEFKLPNLEDYETRTRTTPKTSKMSISVSDSPLLAPPSKAKRKAIFTSSSEDEESPVKPVKKLSRKKRPVNKFIHDEAELSGSASEDELDQDLDGLEESFVDDATQRHDEDNGVDLQAIYLQSTKSPKGRLNHRELKLKPITNHDDIYSQAVTDSMMFDDYEEDSFVAKNDEVEYESSTADELDFVEEFPSKAAKPKPSTSTAATKKRKRIHVMSSSDEEAEEPPKPVQKTPPKVVETPSPPVSSSNVSFNTSFSEF